MDANTPLRGHLSESARAAALAACAVFAVAAAVLLQLLLSLYPCPWCILQRYAFLAFGAVMTLGAFTGAPSTRARLVRAAGLVALSGAAMAGFQLYVKLVPSWACGKDAVACVRGHGELHRPNSTQLPAFIAGWFCGLGGWRSRLG